MPSLQIFPTLVLIAAMVGCTNKNIPLNRDTAPLEARVKNHTRASMNLPAHSNNNTGYFVGIAISGGGSRSANFSAACMLQLQRIGMLQKVDYISSVSGGSLTAAYYCSASDADWNPAIVEKKLSYHFATDLMIAFLEPWNGVAIFFTDYDRSDLLAGIFQKVLFSRNDEPLTFKNLRPDRPRLLINATDLQSGRRFVFCDDTFNELNSDLSKYPLAWACAASGAVPVVLHQVTLRDYSTAFKQYRHFIDGGIADNLGVQSLVETYERQKHQAVIRHLSDPYPKGAILIVLDAGTKYNARLSDKGDTDFLESLEFGSGLTSTALLSRASEATLADLIVKYSAPQTTAEQLRQAITTLETEGYVQVLDRDHRPVHIVHIALSQLSQLTDKLPFNDFSSSVENIATYFNIDPTDAYDLYQAAALLMTDKFESILRPLVHAADVGHDAPSTTQPTLKLSPPGP